MTRPLWQLLLLMRDSKKDIRLTCEECFALLEFDADRLSAGADPAEIRSSVIHHLTSCLSFSTQLDDWLERLEGSIEHYHLKQ
jgi:hypothetical protein